MIALLRKEKCTQYCVPPTLWATPPGGGATFYRRQVLRAKYQHSSRHRHRPIGRSTWLQHKN
ncbi:hypothetical protein [Moorena producens]|uniref:hypothetical protein n=1 Tax=Moorena producens TaxID=1155739 RepID=UPI0011EA6760|nr:hypothetical protein [Moorena producens]